MKVNPNSLVGDELTGSRDFRFVVMVGSDTILVNSTFGGGFGGSFGLGGRGGGTLTTNPQLLSSSPPSFFFLSSKAKTSVQANSIQIPSLYKERFLASLPASQRASADFTRPVFTAVAFYLCSKRHKLKVDKVKMIDISGTNENEFKSLRQACCYPQVGSSGLRSIQHSPMTMQEILEVLVGKTKTGGEEALRKLIVSLNGLAGIVVIEQDPSRAVSMYREELALAEEHYDDFRLDPLLNIHIHHNLTDTQSPQGVWFLAYGLSI